MQYCPKVNRNAIIFRTQYGPNHHGATNSEASRQTGVNVHEYPPENAFQELPAAVSCGRILSLRLKSLCSEQEVRARIKQVSRTKPRALSYCTPFLLRRLASRAHEPGKSLDSKKGKRNASQSFCAISFLVNDLFVGAVANGFAPATQVASLRRKLQITIPTGERSSGKARACRHTMLFSCSLRAVMPYNALEIGRAHV